MRKGRKPKNAPDSKFKVNALRLVLFLFFCKETVPKSHLLRATGEGAQLFGVFYF